MTWNTFLFASLFRLTQVMFSFCPLRVLHLLRRNQEACCRLRCHSGTVKVHVCTRRTWPRTTSLLQKLCQISNSENL
uniref:Secreted protein n=1 Tax=Labrus bergylta TaxID=56723 RepID=A0A3Q3LX34_9LABR